VLGGEINREQLLKRAYALGPEAGAQALEYYKATKPVESKYQAPTVTEFATGEFNDKEEQLFQKMQYNGTEWVPQGAKYTKKSGVEINTGQTPESVENLVSRGYVDQLLESAKGAGTDISRATRAQNMLKYVETGKWQPFVKSIAEWTGLDPDMISSSQVFNTEMGNYVMGQIQNTKGAVSEKEMAFFEEISPSLGKDHFANYAILEIAKRKAERAYDMPRKYSKYIALNKAGKTDLDFRTWYMQTQDKYKGEFDINEVRGRYNKMMGVKDEEPRFTVIEAD
jgi:hypothetical protein